MSHPIIKIKYPMSDIENLTIYLPHKKYISSLIHEVGHLYYTPKNIKNMAKGEDELLMLEMLEDIRIDRKLINIRREYERSYKDIDYKKLSIESKIIINIIFYLTGIYNLCDKKIVSLLKASNLLYLCKEFVSLVEKDGSYNRNLLKKITERLKEATQWHTT